MSHIGQRLRRIEDPPLLNGAACFAGDISFDGQLHMRVVRSPIAFGRLLDIETGDALAMPGVTAVWTGRDTADIPPIDFRQVRLPGLAPYRQPILAGDHVRYVGEPLAIVLAEDAYLAEDAANLVFAEIEEYEPVRHATDAAGEFASGLSSEAAIVHKGYGDLEAAFAAAHEIVELRLHIGRHSGVPLETRGAVACYDAAADVLEIHGAAKIPHLNRDALAKMLGRPAESIQLYEGHVGGGFGIRGELYPEDVLVALAALRLARPIKWIEDRKEHLIAANHARDQSHLIRAAVDERGFVLAIDDEFWADQGAYVRTHAATVADLTAALLPGPYVVPAYLAAGHIRLTNKTPAGTYRAPGRFEGCFVCERLMDAIAHRLDLDPVAVRRINLIPPERMPFERHTDALGTDVVYDSGAYERLLDRLLDHVQYDKLRAQTKARRANGERVGIGLGMFVEKSGLGPFDDVELILHEDERIEVVTGVASLGQGVETSIAQICADGLGARFENITVLHGQTDRIGRGMGAFASRVTVMTGSAVHQAAGEMKQQLLQAASDMLQTPAERLAIEAGVIGIIDRPDGPSLTLGEVVRGDAAFKSVTATFNSKHMTYPYGAHLVVAAIDPETAAVKIERYVVAYDVGRAVNPLLIEGQIAGGIAQGIGGALFEEFVYDDLAQPLAANLADYLMPTLAEIPDFEILIFEDAPSPINPLGVKGAGEGGITAAGAAIAGAVEDALGNAGTIDRLPITPTRLRDLLAGNIMPNG